jgi:hypothetical protein
MLANHRRLTVRDLFGRLVEVCTRAAGGQERRVARHRGRTPSWQVGFAPTGVFIGRSAPPVRHRARMAEPRRTDGPAIRDMPRRLPHVVDGPPEPVLGPAFGRTRVGP